MPIILKPEDEKTWLDGKEISAYDYPYSSDLIAVPI